LAQSKARPAWRQSEISCAYALRHRGVRCKNVGHLNLPWDIVTRGGVRIDVKDSELHGGQWVVNLRRRGDKRKVEADFYVVALRGLEGIRGVTFRLYVILPARPLRKKCHLRWTLRSLLLRYARNIGAWEKILKEEAKRDIRSHGTARA
jgi:hypothetical protein